MNIKLLKKRGESFASALIAILLSIAIFSIAFIGEDRNITGFVTVNIDSSIGNPNLRGFEDVDSLGTLSEGNYYIDGDGVVYWIDDVSKPAIAKVNFIYGEQKHRHIYIDDEGNVGYILK